MSELQWPLARAATIHGNRPALIDSGRILDYSRYHLAVTSLAGELRKTGINSGQYVAILADPSAATAVAIMAVIEAGAVACPLNTRATPDQLRVMLEALPGPICMAEKKFQHLAPDTIEVRPLPETGTQNLNKGEVDAADPSLTGPATAIFTSGSTATPRAVVHSLSNHLHSALGSNENIKLTPGDRWLVALPLCHVGGLSILFRAIVAGAAAVLADCGDDLGAVLDEYEITHCSLVPTQLRRLLTSELPAPVVNRLKAVLVGGGARPANLIKQAYERDFPLYTTYGMTEMASQVTTTQPQASFEDLLTSGRILPFRELHIATDGEVLVRGKTLTAGYLSGDNVTLPLDSEGWFHTGDVGRLDEKGRLHVIGRKDNMFVCAGENIYPEFIEQAMRELEGVDEVAVVGMEDEEYGARPVAFVKTSGGVPDATTVGKQLRGELSGLQIPVAIFEWPEEVSGRLKPDRVRLTRLATTLYASRRN